MHDALFRSSLTSRAIKKKHDIVIKGRKFLKSISELSGLDYLQMEGDCTRILMDAVRVLRVPSSRDNYFQLCIKVDALKETWQQDKSVNYAAAGLNIVTNSFFYIAGVTAATAGAMAVGKAIGAIVFGVVLAMSPWGLLALGVGITLVGIYIAGLTASKIHQGYRFCRDHQMAEITEFVDFINPDPSRSLRAEVMDSEPHQSETATLGYQQD